MKARAGNGNQTRRSRTCFSLIYGLGHATLVLCFLVQQVEHVPFLEGKSSTGRLGIDIHATAGKGDVGFCGNWTLEISVKQPVRIYKGMPIGQLIYFPVLGEILVKYNQKKDAKYNGQINKPVESMMWKNKF